MIPLPRTASLLGQLGLAFALLVGGYASAEPLALLKEPGHVAILRHALAPGTDDPPGFRLEDCATQRNLNETGRQQARALGERIRAAGVEVDQIYSSQWCRCLETAELMAVGEVKPLPDLNSVYGRHRVHEAQRTANMRAFLKRLDPNNSTVLVTHFANIYALTRQSASSGGGVVLRVDEEGRFAVVDHIDPP